MVAPVCGLRPSRAPRTDTLNVPNPTRETLSPEANALPTLFVKESNADFACALEIPASAAMASMSCALFMLFDLKD